MYSVQEVPVAVVGSIVSRGVKGPMIFYSLYITGSRVSSGLIYAFALRKHAFTNILKISPPKTQSFQIKILIFFIFLLKSSNEYPQSMVLSRNKKNNVYPCKP